PSIDGITASGDNIWVEHNQGRVYRIKPRDNLEVNRWWITDEARHGWKHVISDDRLSAPAMRRHGILIDSDYERAHAAAAEGLTKGASGHGGGGTRLALLVSPMLATEEGFLLTQLARQIGTKAVLG